MTDATRELIQRMADELDHYRQLLMDDRRETHALANEARALLSQPEPEGPTDEEILNLAQEHNISYSLIDGSVMRDDALSFARAVLTRWGRPGLEGSTDEGLIQRLLLLAEQAVKEALDYEYGDPEDRYIWRELQELKQLAEKGRSS